MRRFLDSICLGMVVLMLATVGMAFADTYIHTLPIRVLNNSTNVYNNISLLVDINNTQLYQYGYINSTGMNTNVQEGVTAQEYMVGTSKLPIFASLFDINQDRTYKYRLGYSPDKSPGLFPVMVGYGGDLQVTDNDVTLELGNNFTIEQDGFIDTSISGQYVRLVEKQYAFKTYVPSVGTINSSIINLGALAQLTMSPNAPGDITEFTPSAGANWECVDDAPPLGVGADGTSVHETTDHIVWQKDLYNLASPGIHRESYVINATIYFRARSGGVNPGDAKPVIKLNGIEVVGTPVVLPADSIYYNFSEVLARPGGGLWSVDDLEDLQAGVYLKCFNVANLSQLYVEFNYQLATTLEVTASCSSGEHIVKTVADTANLEIYVDDMVTPKDTKALGGVGVPNNGYDWYFMEDNTIPYLDKMEICIPPGTGALWFEPNTMVDPDNVPDRWGNGNIGTINWGTNPADFEIFVGGMESYSTYIPTVSGEEVVPEVFNLPTGLGPTTDASEAVAANLSQYDLFQNAAISMGWSTSTLYGMMMIIPAIVMGFAVLVATNSMLFGGLVFATVLGVAAGTTIIPWWMPVIALLGVVFGVYLVMRT